MRIVQIVPGAGPMYCGACARDAGLARGLMARGHEVTILPLYTPLRLEEPLSGVSDHVLLGGITAFLRERGGFTAKMAGALRGLLDRPSLIAWASGFAVETNAADLGQMTVSVLKGPEGRHADEMERVATYVATLNPDVVYVSNSMLLGLLPALEHLVGKPVVCGVTGEDGFLDELPEFWQKQALALLRSHAERVPLFVAPSQSHAAGMASLLGVPLERFRVVRPALGTVPALEAAPVRETLTIGHLSSVRRVKGPELVLQAARVLAGDGKPITVKMAGRTLEKITQKALQFDASKGALKGRVTFLGELTPEAKEPFFREIDVMCLPSRLKESRAMVALEALSRGIPVVAPALGVFPELAELVGGIEFHTSEDAASIAYALLRVKPSDGHEAAVKVREVFSQGATSAAAEEALISVCPL